LEQIKSQLDTLAASGDAASTVGVYETFLAGCYDKAGEVDDSGGNFGMFFQELFISWIQARQRAGTDPAETVRCVLQWMDHDEYGFCFQIEGDVAKALNKRGFAIFASQLEQRLAAALAPLKETERQRIHDYPWAVRKPYAALRASYLAAGDVRAYLKLCEKIIPSPKDCEHVATLYKAKRRFAEALTWIERGLEAESAGGWTNESSHRLSGLRQELLAGLGRRQESLESAWADFARQPSACGYADVMKYVPRDERPRWHEQALQTAEQADLWAFIDICVETKEWPRLANRVLAVDHAELESISHYVTEKAASGLTRKHPAAAAKIYRALALRVLKAGKSKYYGFALEHLRRVQRLYAKVGNQVEWHATVDEIRRDHARKRGFMASFDALLSGKKPAPTESFAERTRRRWREQTARASTP
jgi:tetratricopeptide (TPR) repeat protein